MDWLRLLVLTGIVIITAALWGSIIYLFSSVQPACHTDEECAAIQCDDYACGDPAR